MNKLLKSTCILLVAACIAGCGNSPRSGQVIEIVSDEILKEKTMVTQKIIPCLWVESDAQAVADYYLSIFKDGKLKELHRYDNPPEAIEQGGQPSFEMASIEIGGVDFTILAAGPYFKFNEAISFVINCKDQDEVDYYWEALTSNGGEEGPCGWCKDKYGLSWQVIPIEYYELVNSEDPAVREKAMKTTMMQTKIILSELK